MNKKTLALASVTLIVVVIGIILFIFKEQIIALLPPNTLPNTQARKIEKLDKFVVLPGNYVLTDKEKELLKNSTYDLIIFEDGAFIDVNFISSLATNKNTAILVANAETKLKESPLPESIGVINPANTTILNCSINNRICGTYTIHKADARNIANGETLKQLDSLDITIQNNTSVTLEYVPYNCESEVCLTNMMSDKEGFPSERLVEDRRFIFSYYIQNKNQSYSPLVSHLPELKISQRDGAVPIFIWEIDNPVTFWEQQSYSFEVKNKDGKSLYKTGRIYNVNKGEYFIPLENPGSNEFTAELQSWVLFSEGTLAFHLEKSHSFTHTFSQIDFSGIDNSHKVEHIGWIPDWGITRGVQSMKKYPSRYTYVSPVWYFPKADGTLTVERNVNHADLLATARRNNTRVIPTISQFDPDILSEVLNKNLDKHVSIIVELVEKNGYEGIDLDYESTYLKDKEKFEEFIRKLSAELKKRNKYFVFTVLPKWSDEKIYNFLPQTRQVQDWAFLAQHTDEIRIMGYDYTSQNSLVPGPMSPILWDEAVIKYALTKIPAEKIVLALPLYSHAWPKPIETDPAGPNNDNPILGSTKNTVSLQHEDINLQKPQVTNYVETYDSWNGEIRATYRDSKVERVMYYLNKQAIDQRILLAKKYKIKGLAYWRIGGEIL
jgi:spore germination protein